MGKYINKGNEAFKRALNTDYVDKTGMIAYINSTLNTERSCSCITRCRRFGKSMAAKMLCAYYDKSCDSRELFAGLNIAKDASFEKYLNKFSVIYLDVTNFTTRFKNDPMIVQHIQDEIKEDILETFPNTRTKPSDDLMAVLYEIADKTSEKFIMIIDEWDAIMREFDRNRETVDDYINLFRRLFKGADSDKIFAGVYATGILPIKKYKNESALNNFREYSMVDPANLAPFFGFTQSEVEKLALQHNADIAKLKQWYDGYQIGDEPSIYNPYSVIEAIYRNRYKNYWEKTGAYDSVSDYIQINFDGLKNDIIKMLAGNRCWVNTTKFQNDMSEIKSKDDVLTVLIHLGYLAYDWNTEECYIPNKEVADEFTNAIEDTSWTQLVKAIQNSRNLLDATIAGNEDFVAKAIDLAHDDNTIILSYNDENSLSCVLSIAYLWAKNEYIIHRELATGKGYADLVMIPRKNINKPALVIELKYGKTTDTAIDQIKQKNYPAKVADYTDNLLLVGINYDKESKTHTCKIEKYITGKEQ